MWYGRELSSLRTASDDAATGAAAGVVAEGHLAHFISDAVDGLGLGAFHARYDKDGPRNQPFHPAMMVKVLVYGYSTGVFSSRKIARKLHEDVAFRVLAARNFPAHRTIRDFRAFHLREVSELFVQVVRLAREMGLVKLGTIAVDGTKVKANASRHMAMSYGHMLKAEARTDQRRLGRARIAHDGWGPSRTRLAPIPTGRWPMRATAARRCSRRSLAAQTLSWPSVARARGTERSMTRRCRSLRRWWPR